jgi:cytochrome c peroxidase
MPSRNPLLGTLLLGLMTLPALAQRTHVGALVGEPPDTSNWPHPAAPDGNIWHRSSASALDLSRQTAIAQLGKVLFWDEQVSSGNYTSCGTCHAPRAGGTDLRLGAMNSNGNSGSFGVPPQSDTGTIDYGFQINPVSSADVLVTPVAAPTMIGAYMFNQLFWDRRAGPDFDDGSGTNTPVPNFTDWAALEDLAVGPPANEVEMGHEALTWSSGFLQTKLNKAFPLALVDASTIPPDVQWITGMGTTYHKIFDIVFGWHPQFGGGGGVTRERFAMALAHYHRTLIPDQAPIDLGTLTTDQRQGFDLIKTRGSCFSCHSSTRSPELTSQGTLDPFDNLFSDGEEHGIDLIGQPRRKTPTLRNVGLHRKFFSTGHGNNNVFNLQDLIRFYNQQQNGLGFDPPLDPTEEAQVLDFLANGLTDPRVASETFPFDRPQLFGELNPTGANVYGNATPGPSGLFARIIACSPPKVDQPIDWWKVGVGEAPRNSTAVLMLGFSSWFGPTIWVDSVFATFATMTDNQGFATAQQPVPMTSALLGSAIYCQWEIDDYGTPSFSDAARFIPY